VEKEVAEKEYQLKQKKKGGAKARAKSAPAAPAGSSVVQVDDDVWSVPSEGEDLGHGKAAKASRTSEEKDAATAARKVARQREGMWKKEVAKAAKCISALNSICQGLGTMQSKCENQKELFAEEMLQGLAQAIEKCVPLRLSSLA
jgi:hypothetical protein